ncbi:uncharacterized protein LOC142661632 [Rhinoderma darwinii]|uniref:uncharacterized protein LOC142661632 n=1 Tax=Rhinoderma darwinii TaxID=43563 RepID=UPI003F6689F2
MDSTALLLSFILSTLVTTSFSLSCLECFGVGGKPCQGSIVTCPPDFNVCVATLENDTKDGKEILLSRQYCGKNDMCTYSGSLTTDFGGRIISTTCCHTSNCSPPTPKVPTKKTEKNGVSCKACSTEKGTSCESSANIDCTGDEKKCVSMTTMTKTGQTSSTEFVSGCGTPEWCEVKDRVIPYGGQTTEFSFTCSAGNDNLPPGLPLLLLTAFLIMKVIY